MNIMAPILAAAITASLSSLAFGITLSNNSVYKTHVNANSGFYFRIEEPLENLDGCTGSGWYKIKGSSPFANEMFSIALAAHMAQKRVELHLSGCESGYRAVAWLNVCND